MADVTARSLQYEYKAVRTGLGRTPGLGAQGGSGRRRKAVCLKACKRTAKAEGRSDPGSLSDELYIRRFQMSPPTSPTLSWVWVIMEIVSSRIG